MKSAMALPDAASQAKAGSGLVQTSAALSYLAANPCTGAVAPAPSPNPSSPNPNPSPDAAQPDTPPEEEIPAAPFAPPVAKKKTGRRFY
jgi:hypothetical protein